jgi:tyrocidine synthetase-3
MSEDRLSRNIWISGGEPLKELEYWMSKLKGQWVMGGVAYDYPAFETPSGEYGSLKYSFKKELAVRINSVTRSSEYGIYMVLLSGVFFLLHKYGNNDDLVVGMPIFKQTVTGEYANSLIALRSRISLSQTYKEYLSGIRKTVEEADSNQNVPFDLLMKQLGIKNDVNGTSPFKTLVMLDCIHDNKCIDGIYFPMKFIFSAQKDSLEVNVEYDTCLYRLETVRAFLIRLEAFYSYALENPQTEISEFSLLSEEEKRKVLYEFNKEMTVSYEDKTLSELFEEQVERTPDNIALVFGNKSLTYRELNYKSNQLAGALREKGVVPGTIVGIMAERSLEMIIGIIGTLKAGGAYLPIDPAYPQDRIQYMLEDSDANILLSTGRVQDIPYFKGTIIDLYDEGIYTGSVENPIRVNSPEDLAYIIYTSGTTGKPKGVMIEQKAISYTIQWRRSEYALDGSDNVLQLFSFSFDGFLTSFFTPIVSGARVVLPGENESRDPGAIGGYIENEGITHFISVPSLYSAILECKDSRDFGSLRIVTLAGDKASTGLIINSKKINPELELVNEYGPTENAVVTTILRNMDQLTSSIIGKPVPGTKLYIINEKKELLPTGIYGELCISGNRLARGYLNRPDISEERFIDNPFIPGERMYRTGDVARWLEDGQIEFLGRMDNQVKIRGYRIEMGEIEGQLSKYEKIRESVVIARDNKDGEKYLCAYYVGREEVKLHEVREFLMKALPEYMIPSYFIQLEKLPLNRNGKVDRAALPEPDGKMSTGTLYRAPGNKTEEKLVEMWCTVLGVEGIGVDDNFFELGGHSLKAMVLVSRIRKELGVQLSLKQLFNNPTVKKLSEAIKKSAESIYDSIGPAEEKEYYTVSSAQKRMYLLNRFEEGTGYNMPAVTLIEGALDRERFENTFKLLIDRHESLRTSFEMLNGTIVQRIHKDIEFKMDYREAPEPDVKNIISAFIKPFDLAKAPLIRVCLVKLEEERHVLIYDMHHIISDGVSAGILVREFISLYVGETLPELRLQYKDFANWQNNLFNAGTINKQEEYWQRVFEGEIPVLNLPTDYVRPAVQSFEGDTFTFGLEKDMTEGIQRLSSMTGTTVYMLLLAVYNVLLAKYSGQEDIIVGSPSAGRPHADLENIIGMFVNTLPMRNFPEGSKSFKEFLREVKENALNAYENQDYQFEDILDRLDIKRDVSRNPLFDVMFSIQNEEYPGIDKAGLSFKPYPFEYRISKFDITLNAYITDEVIYFGIEYGTRLYKKETIEKMAAHFKNIIKTVVRNPEISLNDIDMLDEEEKRQLLYSYNNTQAEYSRDKTFHRLFEEQVVKTPDNIAVVYEDEKLTYRELNEKSNQLAAILRENGVKPGCIVPIMAERSIKMIVGVMGIIKSGGAYLPIDPQYPVEKIIHMIKDSKARVLVSHRGLAFGLPIETNIIDMDSEELFRGPVQNLPHLSKPEDIVYVIYTSGTTGKSKGVLVEHGNFVNISFAWKKEYNLEKQDVRLLQLAGFSFDVFAGDMARALLNGGQMVICPSDVRYDLPALYSLIREHEINIFESTPALIVPLMDYIYDNKLEIDNLKLLIIGSDTLLMKDYRRLLERYGKNMRIINSYGVTEAAIDSAYYEGIPEKLPDSGYVPIGKPLMNTRAYVLSRHGSCQPVGVYGELYIGGDGVSRGYLNQPLLTAEKFMENPFVPGERLYRTGDLARWLPDGNLELAGRMDNQVKIRGYRIELGEIENQLLKHEAVKEAVVVAREERSGSKSLVAYYSAHEELSIQELKEHLSKELPEYMLPSYFVWLKRLPLNSNGKVDRKALPEPAVRAGSDALYTAPGNRTEEKLAEIWNSVLGLDRVGMDENFFDLGGHSLKAMVTVSRIHKELGIQIPLKELFLSPTVRELALALKKYEKSIYESIQPAREQEYYPLSAAQRRMYLLNRFEEGGTGYNMPEVMAIEGLINKDRFEDIFRQLIDRHESLRTSFSMVNGEIVQKVHKEIEFAIEYQEASETRVKDIIGDFIRPFRLDEAPLLRVGLVKLAQDRHILMYDMHHIISDGVSTGILVREFMDLYQGKSLPELRLQYKDFALWQNELFSQEIIKKQEEYWLKAFEGEIPVLNLPTDFVRPSVQSFEGDTVTLDLDKDLSAGLQRLAAATGTTVYMLLLAVYNVLLSKYTGQEDIIVGSPSAGRPHADLENIIGMFVNTLAMRNYPEGSKTFAEFLKEVKENALNAYQNQDYQFEELLDRLNINRNISRNPLFDVMFNIQSEENVNTGSWDISFSPYGFENKISKFDMTLTALVSEDDINFAIEYCTALFRRETIERLAVHLKNIIKAVVKEPEIVLDNIDLLEEEEKRQLLIDFNNTKTGYPKEKTIHELFEEQVRKTPHKTAVVFEDEKMTYAQLNLRADRVACALKEKGVKKDTIVGIMTHKSMEMVVGTLGILKAGGAYLPIDPEYPQDRINYMLKDCNANILMIRGGDRDKVKHLEFEDVEVLEIEDMEAHEDNKGYAEVCNLANSLAYVMYTSGSTGRPKGVAVEHRNVVRLVRNTNYIEFNEEDRILQTGAIVFDATTFELWGALLNGLELYLTGEENILSAEKLGRELEKNKITVLWLTAPLFNQLVQQNAGIFKGLRYLLVGGDRLSPKHINKVREACTGTKIINGYGPTENTTFSVCCHIDRDYGEDIPIGKPISNSYAFILDRNNNLKPIGVYGELCVGGDGLARGYVNMPELTAEKFVENPYKPGEKMYRTGDIARWLPDGNIEFMGRMDNQVKIRGYRIEPGEIETQLQRCPKIKESVVTVKTNKDKEKFLCAYYVSEGELTVQGIREFLLKSLPEYMIPSYFIQLDKLPLNRNGKVDRGALPEPEGKLNTGVSYAAPESMEERILAHIWEKVLGIEKVGVNDEFFVIGGDSLKALKIVYESELREIRLTVNDIFKYKTIAGIVKNLSEKLHKGESIKTEERALGSEKPDVVEIEDRWPLSRTYQKDTPFAKELKIEIQRDITVYMHRCLPLCIILADENIKPWFYEHFINIFSIVNPDSGVYLDYHEVWAPYREIINEISLGAGIMEKEKDIISFIIEKVNQGYYMNIAVDEYYLPGKSRYGKTHFIHFALVYGYDNSKGEVKAVGYGDGNILNAMSFDYRSFTEAYEKGKEYYRDSAVALHDTCENFARYLRNFERFILHDTCEKSYSNFWYIIGCNFNTCIL